MLASPAFAFNYYYNVFGDGTSPFDRNNNSSGWLPGATDPFYYPKVGTLPSPGYYGEGGGKFDIEGLRVVEDDQYLYVALANSFGYNAYSSAWNQNYELGDLFIGVDGQYNKFAIDLFDISAGTVTNTGLYLVNNDWNYMTQIQDVPGSYYGNTFVRDAAGPHQVVTNNLNAIGSVEMTLGFAQGYETNPMYKENGDTYVWEFKLDKALLGNYSTLNFHITLGCGNDFLNETVAPEVIPEPATVLLFGFGLAGAAAAHRRKRR